LLIFKPAWNAKCPIFFSQLYPLKPANIALKIGHLVFQVYVFRCRFFTRFFPPKKFGASTRKAFQVLAQCQRQTPGDFHQPTGIPHHQVFAVTSEECEDPMIPHEKGRGDRPRAEFV